MHFYKLSELTCVLAVCVHNLKIHTVFIFYLLMSSFSNRADLSMTSHWMRPRPQWFDWQVCFSTDCTGVLPQTRPSVVSPTRMTPKRSRCLVVGCNNEHSSRYLLPTSELLKKITFSFDGKGQGIFWQTVCQLRLAIGKANCGTPQLPTRDG